MDEQPGNVGLSAETQVMQSPDALAAEVGGEVVLLNVVNGYFHQLNAVGSYLWKRLSEPRTFESLCRQALDDFDADAESCRRDVTAFVLELHSRGLVRFQRV